MNPRLGLHSSTRVYTKLSSSLAPEASVCSLSDQLPQCQTLSQERPSSPGEWRWPCLGHFHPHVVGELGGVQSLPCQPEGGAPPDPNCAAQSLEMRPKGRTPAEFLSPSEGRRSLPGINQTHLAAAESRVVLRIRSNQPKPERGCKAKINKGQALGAPPPKLRSGKPQVFLQPQLLPNPDRAVTWPFLIPVTTPQFYHPFFCSFHFPLST